MLLQIHGGAWILGSKNEQGIPLMVELASHGWVCVSADYRLSPRATFPDHLVDLKRAIAWDEIVKLRVGVAARCAHVCGRGPTTGQSTRDACQ